MTKEERIEILEEASTYLRNIFIRPADDILTKMYHAFLAYENIGKVIEDFKCGE